MRGKEYFWQRAVAYVTLQIVMRAAKMFVRFLKGEKEGAKHKYGYVPVVKIHLHHSLLPGKSCSSQGVHKAWPHSCCRNCVVYTDSGR